MFVGDGSYLMMNSDLYSSVLSGHKLIVIVCDNGGFAVINRLQVNQGGGRSTTCSQNTRHRASSWTSTSPPTPRRWAATARRPRPIAELEAAFERARHSRPHHGHRHADRPRTPGPAAARSGRSACPRSATARSPGREGRDGCRQGRPTSGVVSAMDDEAIGLDGKVDRRHGGTQGLGEAVARLAARARRGRHRRRRPGQGEGRDGGGRARATSAPTALFVAAELAEPDVAERVIDAADEHFGVVHGVVNAAAETSRASVWDVTTDHFDRMIAVNVRTPLFLIQAAARVMRREGVGGSIVNIGSVSGYGGQVYLSLRHLEGRAAHADPQPRLLADARPHPGQPREPGLDGHAGRARRPARRSTARATTGWSGRRRNSPSGG